ncbi:MAG: hypothetical protein V7727_21915 [Sneathiella sp.]
MKKQKTILIICTLLSIGVAACGPNEQEIAAQKIEKEQQLAKAVETKRKGFHCLSGWDGSHIKLASYVENNLRDPDSYDHIETRISPVTKTGTHTLSMKYRARNGFGGMTIGQVAATIQNEGCGFTIVSSE